MAAVRTLCSRALLLEGGRLVEDGPFETVLARYMASNQPGHSATTALPAGEPDAPGHGVAVHISGLDGQPASHFRLGEAWRVRVEFEIGHALPHVIASFGLQGLDGTPIITWWSAPRDLAPGRYIAEYECDIPLAPTEATLTVGLTSDEKFVYYAERVGAVSISDISAGPQPHRASGSGMFFSTERPEIQAA
jgi:hypothetical protein